MKENKINIENARTYSEIYSVDCVLSLLEKNDIIEILIASGDQIIKLGASSDSHPGKAFDISADKARRYPTNPPSRS